MKSKTGERWSQVFKRTPYFLREARDVGQRLLEIRQAQQLTLERLAELSTCDAPSIQKIETAKDSNISLVTLARLSIGLRQPIAVFFGGHVLARQQPMPQSIYEVYAELEKEDKAAGKPWRR